MKHFSLACLALAILPESCFAQAAMAPASAPVLTEIARAPRDGCTQSFDLAQRRIFAHTWTDDWRVGINGRTVAFSLRNSSYDNKTGAFALYSKDRKISVRTQPTGQSVSTRDHDADIVMVTLTVSGAVYRTKAYRICPPGD